jgi:hypothetical protein
MTRIEKQIYQLLERKTVSAEDLALPYRVALSASVGVYNKIDWRRLEDAIKDALGTKGLLKVKRQASELP